MLQTSQNTFDLTNSWTWRLNTFNDSGSVTYKTLMNTGDNKQLFLYQWMLSFLDSWVKLKTFCGKKRDIYFTYFKNFLRISLFSFLENMNKPFHKTTRCKWKEHNMLLWHGQLIWKDLLLLVPNFCSSWFYNHFFLSYFRQSENIEGMMFTHQLFQPKHSLFIKPSSILWNLFGNVWFFWFSTWTLLFLFF